MLDQAYLSTRRSFLRTIATGTVGTVLFEPINAEAGFFGGVFFLVRSFGLAGPIGLGIGALALGATAYAAGNAIHASFKNWQGSGNSYSSSGVRYQANAPSGWKSYKPPKPIVIRISCDPTQQVKGDVLRLRAIEHDILKNDGVILPRGGRLVIEESGSMQFADTPFKGYARMQQDGDLSVWTEDDRLALVRSPGERQIRNLHHDSDEGRTALTSLLGDIRHA